MPQRSYHQYCALARALDVMGDRWSMLIVRNLLLGPLRWSELLDNLPGMARNLLSGRLTQLEEDGILQHDGDRYTLTPRGAELEPALFALASWGERHFLGAPRADDAILVRYLMTSIRRRLRPGRVSARVQLRVGGAPFIVALGATPTVVAGEDSSDATVDCDLGGVRALLVQGEPPRELAGRGLVRIEGDLGAVEELVRACQAASPAAR
jgi:DNA-binding HxlR family transcriptional regulator